jgi:transposase InsO family protein
MPLQDNKPNTSNLMFHSDQGTQYSSKAFIDYCNQNNITQSMSKKGNCWDNAVMERFFRSLKTERLNYQSFANHLTRTIQLLVLKPNQGRWLNNSSLDRF